MTVGVMLVMQSRHWSKLSTSDRAGATEKAHGFSLLQR